MKSFVLLCQNLYLDSFPVNLTFYGLWFMEHFLWLVAHGTLYKTYKTSYTGLTNNNSHSPTKLYGTHLLDWHYVRLVLC